MPAGNAVVHEFLPVEIEGPLRLPDAGRRLDGNPEDDGVAVAQAAIDASGAVAGGVAGGVDDGIVVFGALHPGGGEAVAEFDTAQARNREDGVGQQ